MNASRMFDSAERLEMPGFPKDRFVEAVKEVVKANAAWVPPFGSGATLYVRPFMIGSGEVIGVAPAPEYTFRILVTPVGPYFKGGLKPIKLRVSEYDRAAPHGTGNIKAGLNYAMSLRPTMEAHRSGYAENIYLDSQSRTYIEETGGANVLFVKEDGTLVVPKSHTDSILPSITRRSLGAGCPGPGHDRRRALCHGKRLPAASSSSAACAALRPSSARSARSTTRSTVPTRRSSSRLAAPRSARS